LPGPLLNKLGNQNLEELPNAREQIADDVVGGQFEFVRRVAGSLDHALDQILGLGPQVLRKDDLDDCLQKLRATQVVALAHAVKNLEASLS